MIGQQIAGTCIYSTDQVSLGTDAGLILYVCTTTVLTPLVPPSILEVSIVLTVTGTYTHIFSSMSQYSYLSNNIAD